MAEDFETDGFGALMQTTTSLHHGVVREVDPLTDPRWAELVERAPDAGIFHHPAWLRLLHERYRYPMSAVCLAGGDGELRAGLPLARIESRLTGKRLVSVPFSDVCGPIVLGQELTEPLIAAIAEFRARSGLPLEIHAEVPALPGAGISDRFYQHVVPLADGPEVVLGKRIKQSKRRGAELARKSGVVVRRATDRGALDAFFRLHVLTRHRLGVPTQPRGFFRGLHDLFDNGLGFVLLAELDGRPVAANVYLRHRDRMTYKYGASDAAYLDKRPNDLLHLEGLRIACEAGCQLLDLGRTELYNEGLRRFKRQLGAEERELSYTMTPPPQDNKSVRSLSALQQTMIRRAPSAFGRALGAVVYRHFA
jgi:CelD/BcsL family acetyltransferase involved in cellulose biosynthesis